MSRPAIRKYLVVIGLFAALWLALKYLLPVALPFLLGGGLALGAEPLVGFLCRKLRLKRGPAAGIGITAALAMMTLVLMVLGFWISYQLSKKEGQEP